MAFREDFVWGAASSAYQTEGFPSADGGGESIWDAFCRRPGAIANGDNGSIACDGYHRFEEDIRLLSSLGLRAYRFSTSWARIDPNGDGRWNEAGLQYYDRVVDCCLANGVTPWMTLYHWELPQALEQMQRTGCPILFYENATAPAKQVIAKAMESGKELEIAVLIGAEGGFDEDEVALAREHGCHILSLGKRILRCETAPLAALTILMYETGNME